MIETTPAPFKPNAMTRILAARIEGALGAETREDLETLSGRLQAMMDGFLSKATPEIREALAGNAPQGSPLTLCYLIGQISLGQALTAQALASRPDDGFFEGFRNPEFRTLLNLLASGMRPVDLSDMAGRTEAAVTADLSGMEGLGLVTRRQDGDAWAYARTPAAEAMLAHEHASETVPGDR